MGGQGTACRLSWRLAVVLPSDPAGDVYQLVLPATSAFGKEEGGKWPFRPYIQMLANNNVSAGRVVTKMQFDINYPVPRLLFSPVNAVSTDTKDTIIQQGKSLAAENAVRLTVYKSDAPEEEVAQPQAMTQPVKQESTKKASSVAPDDVSNIINKWSKK
jgi:hypothetical protein